MNAFPNGTRVFFWASGGEIKYGTVQATNRMADGTQIVVMKVDGEGHGSLQEPMDIFDEGEVNVAGNDAQPEYMIVDQVDGDVDMCPHSEYMDIDMEYTMTTSS